MGNYNTRTIKFRQSISDFPMTVFLGVKNPYWGLSRWGGKEQLRFTPLNDEGFTLRGNRQRLVYKGRRRSHRFTILGDGAFEYDCILLKPPDTNVISLLMEGAEYFDFLRQPDFVPDLFLKGSYAVYKKETLIGEGTGKLCHIHRPEIIDAKGRRCWGDLSIVGNELRITIPEQWLAEAVYPVIVDPTIGTTTIGSQITGPDPNNSGYDRPYLDGEYALNKYQVPQNGSGLCTAFLYCYYPDSNSFVTPLLYSNVSNKPFKKISRNEKEIDVTIWPPSWPVGWRSNTFQLDGSINAGDFVWYGMWASWFATRFDYGGEGYKGWFDYSLFPDYEDEPTPYIHIGPWDTFTNIRWSWYFTYTAVTSQNYVRTLTQGVSLTDTRRLTADYRRSATEIARVNTVLSRFATIFRKCELTVQNTMNLGRLPFFNRAVLENVKAGSGKKENLSYSRICNDDVTVKSENKRIHNVFRVIHNGLKCFDSNSIAIILLRSITDEVKIMHTTSHWGAFIRGLFITVDITADTTHEANYFRFHADRVQANGSVFRGLLLFVRIVSQVFIRDYLLGRFLKARQEIVLKSCVCRELNLESKIG